jgi:hypothetical protein
LENLTPTSDLNVARARWCGLNEGVPKRQP